MIVGIKDFVTRYQRLEILPHPHEILNSNILLDIKTIKKNKQNNILMIDFPDKYIQTDSNQLLIGNQTIS